MYEGRGNPKHTCVDRHAAVLGAVLGAEHNNTGSVLGAVLGATGFGGPVLKLPRLAPIASSLIIFPLRCYYRFPLAAATQAVIPPNTGTLKNPFGLFAYLQEKIVRDNTCIACNRIFHS